MADTESEYLCNELSRQLQALRKGDEAARRRATTAARRIITEIIDPEEEIEQNAIQVR